MGNEGKDPEIHKKVTHQEKCAADPHSPKHSIGVVEVSMLAG
jgi:hypothetical protein